MKIIIIIFSMIVLHSCGDSTNFCNQQYFSFKNKKGDDIFNIDTAGGIKPTDLKLFRNSQEEVEVIVWQEDSTYMFEVFFDMNYDTTFIKIGDITTDTIITKFAEKGATTYIEKLYYNGVLTDRISTCDNEVINITVIPD